MKQHTLGTNGPLVSAQGLGCMGMSISYGEPNDEESIATIHRALELGVNLIVTSDAYGGGVNEELVGRALKGRRSSALIATKFGNLRLAGVNTPGLTGGHPDYVPQACDASLRRLGVDVIDIYGLHRVDPTVPIEDTVGAMKRLVEQGKVRYLALSEAGPETIRRAHKVHPIVAVETEYSLWSRDAEARCAADLPGTGDRLHGLCAARPRIPDRHHQEPGHLVAERPAARPPAFQSGQFRAQRRSSRPDRADRVAKKCTPAQVALAWVHAQGNDIVPIPGTKHRSYLEQNVAALDMTLSKEEVDALTRAFPIGVTAGTRYPEPQMRTVGL